jgi:hypothetical protein
VYDRARLEREHEIMKSLAACLRASSVFVLSMRPIDFLSFLVSFQFLYCGLTLKGQITCDRLLPTSPRSVLSDLSTESMMQCAIGRPRYQSDHLVGEQYLGC